MNEKAMTVKNAESTEEGREQSHPGPYKMRRTINSTAYEVDVYFSQTSRETLKDKILRMIRNEVRQ
jgi:hypothetical protein